MAKAEKTEKTDVTPQTEKADSNVVVTKLPNGTVIENSVGERK